MTVLTHWREDAACPDTDPDLFFLIGTTGASLGQIEEAKQICRTCPAQVQCLAWALENGSPTAYGRHDPGRAARHPEPSGNKTIGKEDDGNKNSHPAEHGEHRRRTPAAQPKPAGILRRAGIGP